MRLELREITKGASASAGRPKWFFERGRRTLGRSPDCDWQLPEDRRSISKLHCIIERDREGFLLRDQSANGSRVDGIALHEGEIARLSDKSRLEFGGLAFSVHISGEKDRDIEDPDAGLALSDERLTISAILADIAPGGGTATGILGERISDSWPLTATDAREGVSSSRTVEIGWSGPPEIRSASSILPDDWNADESDYGSHLEHGSALHVAVPIAPGREAAEVDDSAPQPVPDEFPTLSIGRSATFADRLEPLLGRLEEALENAYAVFEIDPPPPAGEPNLDGGREEALLARFEGLLGRQLKLNAGLGVLLQEASRMMEPRLVEARVDAGARRLPWRRDHNYWQAYRAQFEENGKDRSVLTVFSEAMRQAVNGTRSGSQNRQEGKDAHHEE